MDTNKKRSFLKICAVPAAAMVAASLIAPGIGEASEAETNPNEVIEFTLPPIEDAAVPVLPNAPGALTPPPPPSPSDNFMMSLAANRYLGNTYNQMTAAGSNTVTISAGTSSQGGVGQVGVTVTLQQWNGSSWVNIGSPRSSTSIGSVGLNYNVTVAKGYYYRSQSEHWAGSGAARESGNAYSNSVLVSK